jgi:hypothetical protein
VKSKKKNNEFDSFLIGKKKKKKKEKKRKKSEFPSGSKFWKSQSSKNHISLQGQMFSAIPITKIRFSHD